MKKAISEFSCASVSKRVYVHLSYENEFCIEFHFHAYQSHFHENGFALGLALKQRHKGTRKRPIGNKFNVLSKQNESIPIWRQKIHSNCFVQLLTVRNSLCLQFDFVDIGCTSLCIASL